MRIEKIRVFAFLTALFVLSGCNTGAENRLLAGMRSCEIGGAQSAMVSIERRANNHKAQYINYIVFCGQ